MKEKKEYATPNSLCGTPVEARLLDPLLPSGKELSLKKVDVLLNHGIVHCELSVDGDVVFVATQEWRGRGTHALSVAELQPELEPENVEGGKDFQYGQQGAAKRVACADPKKKGWDLFAITRIPGPQKPDLRAVKAFTENYSKAVAASPQCSR
ncbi:hypothetical protein [Streptomyces sp. 891-h]|uniref:hypothetical protein n=1 Tax=Streptomyces sp. 891-h TaxID=2720714 RepID=UPI001FA9FB68|nr:hypothetical protein [Streptomyces sp. 891-h]UNZ19851.1 hypothetical protein HC362_25230 [Streptomyces sp. 891-h]